MQRHDRYDSLIAWYADQHKLPVALVKRQMMAESSARPDAISPAGALGLMQFMPATWKEWGKGDPFNPEESIAAGCAYLAWLHGRFGEISDAHERWRFALAAYNCGRGNVNLMLAAAREADGAPRSYREWEQQGRKPGKWQTWQFASGYLRRITGNHSRETLGYIKKILPYGEEDAIC